jgi:outer membrane protein
MGRSVPVSTFVLSLLLATTSHAQTLLDAYKLAREGDPKYRAAVHESRASGTAIDQARAGFMPTLRFDAEHVDTRQRILSSNNPIFGAGLTTFPTDSQTFSVTQPLFRKDVIERYAQAKAVVRQAQFTVLAAEQDLILRTTAAYLSVLAAADSVALATAEREAVSRSLELARERLRMGLGTITNLHDATARQAVTQAREIEAQNKLRDARQALREITGRTFDRVQALRDDFALQTPDPAVLERWIDSAFDQNLPLRARREAVEVARQEVERQRAGHYPSVNLLLSHNRRDSGSTLFGGGSSVETTDLTLRLSVPIFDGFLTTSVTQEAAHRFQKVQEDLELERRAVERQTRAAYDGTISGVALIRALRQSVDSQQSALSAKEEGYRAGLLTLLPVLDAQRDLFLAKRDFAQARYDYLVNRLRLKQAAGTLAEADLGSVSAALQ